MKCPKCNIEISHNETVEFSFATGDEKMVEVRIAGKCPICGNPYIWTTAYKFDSEYDLEDDV